MMNFKKHEIALELQKTLKEGFYEIMKMEWPILDDITNIYDQPIKLCLDLLYLYHNHTIDPSKHILLKQFENKYSGLNQKVLTSINDEDLIPLIQCMKNIQPIIHS